MSVFGIHKVADHWRCFDDSGDLPGEFFDRETARWGSWITEADAQRINEGEHRLIIMDDVRERIRARTAQGMPLSENGEAG